MGLHGLASITVGVPNVDDTIAYYEDFGLAQTQPGVLSSSDGGEQLKIVAAPQRTLVELVIRADDRDDVARITDDLARLHLTPEATADEVSIVDPVNGVRAVVRVAPPLIEVSRPAPPYNAPASMARPAGVRASVTGRNGPVRPRRLGHVVIGTTDYQASVALYTRGFGFKISDYIPGVGAFLRCSTDHHNLLVLKAPVCFLHHSSWQVDDVDEIGRGAMAMLEGHPERHVWGLGRHYAGSNFFYYLKDPAGNFCEYYSDMDYIIDDQLWTPEDCEGANGLFTWGPPPPASFLAPEDLADLMIASHSTRVPA
jgi:catechol 2,3-dioxygenase-like lactoylglutathione lyase family enzyme